MATVINNPTPATTSVERSVRVERTDNSAGWAVAVIVLLAVIVGGAFLWARYHYYPVAPATTPAASAPASANINVTLPTGGATNPAPGPANGSPQPTANQ